MSKKNRLSRILWSNARKLLSVLFIFVGQLFVSYQSPAQDAPQSVLPIGHSSYVKSVAFSPSGRYVISGSSDKTLKLWEVSSGQEVRTFSGHRGGVGSVAFSPDGHYIISGSWDMKLWEVSSGREVRTFSGDSAGASSGAFSPDGRYVISAHFLNYKIKLWEVSTGQEIRNFTGHKGWVTSVAFSPDSRFIISGSWDKTLILWEVSSGRKVRTFSGHTSNVYSVAFSPDGRFVVSGSHDETLKLWEVSSGREIRTFSRHHPVISVAFSPDGRYIISGSYDKAFKLWEVSSGREVRTFSGHTSEVNSVAFSPDGRYVISSSDDKTIKLWEVSSGREIRTFSGRTSEVNFVTFSPDGRYFISSSPNRTLGLWEVSSGRKDVLFSGHVNRSYMPSVAFSPDGRYIISGSWDKTLKLWEVSSGREVRTFSGHTGDVLSVAFSPDGQYLISGSEDKTLKFWNVSTGNLLFSCINFDNLDWLVVTPDGRFDGSPDSIKLLHYAKDNKSIPLDALFDRFYTPNLVARVLTGETIAADADIRKGIQMPPLVRILSPRAGQTLQQRTVKVEVEAVDQGGGVEDIRLYHNGKRVGGVGRAIKVTARPSKSVRHIFTVSLVNGANTLRATAFSRDRTKAQPYELTIYAEGFKFKANLHIVAVGINRYKNSRYNLNYAVKDARAIVASLRARGQGIFQDIYVHTVFNEEATRSGIEAAFERVVQQAQPEDVFVFYYAGHGVMREGSVQQPADFYFIPTDVTQIYGNVAVLAEKAISATQLKDVCQRIEARKQLLIIDACQSGAAVDKFALRGTAEEKAIAHLARSAGVVVLASALSEQFAVEVRDLGHGLFTYTLLQALNGKADGSPKDGRVTVSELSGYVQAQIPELTRRYRGESQYPSVFVHGQDFPVAVPSSK